MLEPKFDILPQAQRELWPALVEIPDNFVLYGGTALALRLGHRSSVDFDFFSSQTLDTEALYKIPFIADAEVLQREPTALTLSVNPPDPVTVSFFGDIGFGRVRSPDQTADGVLAVASLLDLFGTKLKVLLSASRRATIWIWPRSCVPASRCRTGWAPPWRCTAMSSRRPTPSRRLPTTKRTLRDRSMARRAAI